MSSDYQQITKQVQTVNNQGTVREGVQGSAGSCSPQRLCLDAGKLGVLGN